jgi:predicted RNA-binding Zn ribbon-like protein
MMNFTSRPAAQMKLVGGWLCLDFVNTTGGRLAQAGKKEPAYNVLSDKLKDYGDLLAWSLHTGLFTDAQAQSLWRESQQHPEEAFEVLRRAVALREAIYRLCWAIIYEMPTQASDLTLLNQELTIARQHRQLVATADGFDWQWTASKRAIDRMLWAVAESAAQLLTIGELSRLKQCPGERCGWLFADTSRNRSRQWCIMEDCGNVAKVRRFRSRSANQSK